MINKKKFINRYYTARAHLPFLNVGERNRTYTGIDVHVNVHLHSILFKNVHLHECF